MDAKNKTFPLLLLPSLVIQRVVEFLDFTSLKRLRLTCSYTKNVINSPQNTKRLIVTLKERQRLNEILKSRTSWCSFKFIVSDQFPLKDDLTNWHAFYGNSSKVISVRRFSVTLSPNLFATVVNYIIQTCSFLESLEVGELDFTKVPAGSWSTILQNLKCISNLSLQRIVYISDHTREYFGDIVKNSTSLSLLSLPRLQASLNAVSSVPVSVDNDNAGFHGRSVIQEYNDFVVSPVIEKVSEDLRRVGRTTIRTIICPEELVSFEMYIKLAQICVDAQIIMHFLEPSIIPSHILRTSQEDNLFLLSKYIGSIAGVNDELLLCPLVKLKHLTINRSNFLCKSDTQYPIPKLPNLESLSLHLSTWSTLHRDTACVKRLSAFITCLQSKCRPSIKSIFISRFPRNEMWPCPHASLVRPYLILACVNLTSLELEAVTYSPADFLTLWFNLRKLEKIILKSCMGVNNAAIIGVDKQTPTPSLLSLSSLKELILDEVGEVTYLSYKHIFSNMRLIKFYHTPKMDFPIHENSLLTLVTGTVWEHLEVFQSMGIGFTNLEEKNEFANKMHQYQYYSVDYFSNNNMTMEMHMVDEADGKRRMFNKGCLCC